MSTRPSPALFRATAWSAATVSDMQALVGVAVNDAIFTAGYHSAGDGGAMQYIVVAAGTGADDGGAFIDLTASGLQARAMFGINPTPFHFGAVGDGVTDDAAALQEWIYFMEAVVGSPPGLTGPQMELNLCGGVFAISNPIAIGKRGAMLRQGTLRAIGTWDSGTYMVTWGASYSCMENVRLYCGRNAPSGVYVTGGRTKLDRCQVFEYTEYGIHIPDIPGTSGPEVWVHQCIIGELDSVFNSVLFANNANFTGTGLQIDKSDCKVSDTIIRWTGCCYRATAGMQDIYNCHFYQGGASVLQRNNGVIIEWTAGSGGELTIDGLYHDNGYSNFYSDRVNIRNIRVICDSSNMVPRAILNFYANQDAQPARCNIRGVEVREWSTGATLIDFLSYGANTWAPNYASIETFLADFIENNRQNFSLNFNSTQVAFSTEAHNNREFWMMSGGNVTRVGLADRNTDTSSPPYVGCSGNNLTLGAPAGKVDLVSVLRQHRLSADPASAADGDCYYNTTSNKFRGRAGGAWVDLH